MTMVLLILEEHRATIEAPMLIFSNENRSYPIWGLVDDISRVSYRTGPKGWMDQTIYFEFFLKPRAYQANLYQCMKIIWLDNCSDHAIIIVQACQTIIDWAFLGSKSSAILLQPSSLGMVPS